MKVDHAVAHAFIKEGTSTIFGLLGDSQLAWWPEMAKHPGVNIIDVRDEGAAVAMADGWARATGRVGVASVTHGPGVSRTATSLITATRYRTPIVIHTGATPFNKEQALQYLDQEKLVSATGAGYIEVLTPDYAETAVRDAFYRAQVEAAADRAFHSVGRAEQGMHKQGRRLPAVVADPARAAAHTSRRRAFAGRGQPDFGQQPDRDHGGPRCDGAGVRQGHRPSRPAAGRADRADAACEGTARG